MSHWTTAVELQLQQPHKNKTVPQEGKDKSPSRVPVTALIAWPTFYP
jgi:hypothetical protein